VLAAHISGIFEQQGPAALVDGDGVARKLLGGELSKKAGKLYVYPVITCLVIGRSSRGPLRKAAHERRLLGV
jgi:hypothetical protein